MQHYDLKKTRTRLTMPRRLKLIALLVSAGAILTQASFLSLSGPEQACAPTVSQTSPLTAESLVKEAPSSMPTIFVEFEPEVVSKYSPYEVTLVCQTVYGEARGCSREEQMLVAWCICNRADNSGTSIEQVVKAPSQFHGYSPEHPVTDEIRSAVLEVLNAWSSGQEALVYAPYATTSDYLYFSGDGAHNWFREEY